MLYMLDTNICIYLITGRPRQVIERLEMQMAGSVVMSVITYAELCAGLWTSSTKPERDAEVLSLLIQRIPVLPLEEAGAEHYGRLRAASPGRRRNALDRLIAAHAISVGATLVTNNEADFSDFPGLSIENWAEPQGVSESAQPVYAPRATKSARSRQRQPKSAGA